MPRAGLESVLSKTLNELWDRMAAFAPNVLAMLVILAAGALVAGAVHLVVRFGLSAVGFDRFASRSGVRTVLERGGVARPASSVVALVLAWTVLAGFVILAIGALDLQIAVDLLSRGFLYLPQVLIALALVTFGTIVGAVLRRSVLIAAVNAGIPLARGLAAGVQIGVLILFAAMALEQLGVGRQIIVVAFTLLFGGVVLALALAFGLGGQSLARDILAQLAHRGPAAPADDARRHL